MKKSIYVAIFICAFLFNISLAFAKDVFVRGYYRSDGTYVQPHYRSRPDGNIFNNWSTKGNLNPYTGEWGTKDPWKEMERRQNKGLWP